MKYLFVKWLSALLIATLLLSPVALMEQDAETVETGAVTETLSNETPVKSSDEESVEEPAGDDARESTEEPVGDDARESTEEPAGDDARESTEEPTREPIEEIIVEDVDEVVKEMETELYVEDEDEESLVEIVNAEANYTLFESKQPEKDQNGNLLINENNFPDAALRQYLIGQANYLYDNYFYDGNIYYTQQQIESFTSASIPGSVKNLAGLEYFPYITSLTLGYGIVIETLDLTVFDSLVSFRCYSGNIKYLNIHGLKKLISVDCPNCQIITLDAGDCSALQTLNAFGNFYDEKSELNIIGCGSLVTLSCGGNNWSQSKLKSIEISNLTNLVEFNINNNESIKTLSASGCIKLEKIYCNNCTKLEAINISECTNLKTLECERTRLKALSLDDKDNLERLCCEGCQLEMLNLKNKKKLRTVECFNNRLKNLDVSGCESLEILGAGGNASYRYDTLKVSGCSSLKELYVSSNNLTELDISDCVSLDTLDLDFNKLSELDVSNCPNLINLYCKSNSLTELNVSNNTELKYLDCEHNKLTSLELGENNKLKYLKCAKNNFDSLDISRCEELVDIVDVDHYVPRYYDIESYFNSPYITYGPDEEVSYDAHVIIIGGNPAAPIPKKLEENTPSNSSGGSSGSGSGSSSGSGGSSGSVVVAAPAAPAGPAITIAKTPAAVKAKAAKKGKVTVSWKKIKKTKKTKALLNQIKGIEVQYSTDPNFAADMVTKSVSKKKTKLTLKLQKKTVYYIRVRYTDGAGGVSNWSAVKRVKTKK